MTLSPRTLTVQQVDDLLAYLTVAGDLPVPVDDGPLRFVAWQDMSLEAVGLTAEGAMDAARLRWLQLHADDPTDERPMSAVLEELRSTTHLVAVRWPLALLRSFEPLAVEGGAL